MKAQTITPQWFRQYVTEGTCVNCQKSGNCVMFYETEIISPRLSIAMRSYCQRCATKEAREQLKLYGSFEIAKPKQTQE